MKILVFGAGVTGLTMGHLLHRTHDVTILEKESFIGGLARTKQMNGITYHLTGGHCFNSKYEDVMSFVFGLLPKEKWHLVKRTSAINLGKYEVSYPIEYSVRQIYQNDADLAFAVTKEFLSVSDDGNYSDLEQWFRKKFGNALCDLYFIPYNTKIWGRKPCEMDYKWVQDKLPIPDKVSFFQSLMDYRSDTMPHSRFYYPNTNDQSSLFEALADGLNIVCNEKVSSIKKENNQWVVNNTYMADVLISTLPLNELPNYIKDVPETVLHSTRKLKYNKVSNVLWESIPTEKTWTYQPLPDSIFHRYIHIGNFFLPQKNYTITECIGEKSFEEMVACGRKDPFLVRPLDYHISDHAYVVFDENRESSVSHIQKYLESIGLYSIGRFGQWEYFNMDVCMKQCLNLYENLKRI